MIQQLIQIGFNEKEAKVYEACLELGKASIARIVRKSGVSKKLSYKALDFLMKEGYVVAEGKKKKLFSISDIELIGINIQKRLNIYQNLLPELYSKKQHEDLGGSVNVYDDTQGIRNLYKHQMRREVAGATSLAIESPLFHFIEFMNAGRGGCDFDIYERLRLSKDISLELIFLVSKEKLWSLDFEVGAFRKKREIRTLIGVLSNPISNMHIWSDRVFLFIYRNSASQTLIELVGKEIRDGFVSYFGSLWQSAQVVR